MPEILSNLVQSSIFLVAYSFIILYSLFDIRNLLSCSKQINKPDFYFPFSQKSLHLLLPLNSFYLPRKELKIIK